MIKIQLYQFEVAFGDLEANKSKIKQFFENELNEDTDIVVFPEMWNNGYALEHLNEKADNNLGNTKQFISNLANQFKVNVVAGSVSNKKDDAVYNTLVVFNEHGDLIYDYDKIHLVPMLNEPKYLASGNFLPETFDLCDIKMGGIICYDLRFPEPIRRLAINESKVIFVVAQWPKSRLYHWKQLNIARAIENETYIVACNSCGNDENTEYAGHSLVIAPNGDVISEANNQETILSVKIDSNKVNEIRNQIPVFKNRRTDLYS